jgi:L-ascorbate metabolism protein UlaG (beta-lactamase superfamily)
MAVTIQWLNHATFRLSNGGVIYIDPWKISGSDKADVVIVSHSHFDHLSPDDVARVSGPHTQVVTTPDCADKIAGVVHPVKPGDTVAIHEITVEAIPAYNPHKQFHPKANGWIGVVVTLDGKRVYYAGDTDLIPEMDDLTDIDVALLPVGGTYTMDAAEAAQATKRFRPRLAVPYHWGDIVGKRSDAEAFARAAGCPVTVLEPGEKLELA